MKINRKAFFKIHSWIGIKLSILFFVVCFSGTLATLSHEMDWLFFPGMRATAQQELAPKNQLVQNIQKAYPKGEIEYWSAAAEPYLCDIVYVKTDGQRYYVFANPYTGEVQGATTLTFQRFFRDLHYYLFIPFQIGHFTVLLFAFLLIISMGTALLFYKKWYKKLFELKTGKGPVVFFRSLHRLVGVWSVPFVILFSITGIWYFTERANIGGVSDIANAGAPPMEMQITDSTRFANISYTFDYDRAVRTAESQIAGLAVKDIVPPSINRPAYLTGTSTVPLVRNRANRIYLHPETYEVVHVQKAETMPTVTWLNDIADPLHFGYWGGLATKIIWFVAGLGISGLVLTGIWVSLKRRFKSRQQQKAQQMGIWKYINWAIFIIMLSFMYYFLIVRYSASITALTVITIGWVVFIALGWYIFDYKIKQTVRREKVKKSSARPQRQAQA